MDNINFFEQIISKFDSTELDQFINIQKRIMQSSDNVFAESTKSINKAPAICMVPECNQKTQKYCHLLQRNGILNNISDQNHLIQLVIRDVYKWSNAHPLEFKKIGIANAFSGRLFCDMHDTNIFKKIETNILDFNDYNTQILFMYRSLCHELREDEYGTKVSEKRMSRYEEIIKSIENEPVSSRVINLATHGLDESIKGEKLYICNTKYKILEGAEFKSLFESEMSDPTGKFETIHVETNLLEIAVSSVFSTELYQTDQDKNYPIFIQIIPYNNKSHIIIGYHKNYCDDWMRSYLLKWSSFSSLEIKIECSRLLLTRLTTWCMSPRLYESFNSTEQEGLLKYHLQYLSNKMERTTIEDWNNNIKFNMFKR